MSTYYDKIKALVEEMAPDVDKLYNGNNKSAGRRLRKKIQEMRSISKEWRSDIQVVRGVNKDTE